MGGVIASQPQMRLKLSVKLFLTPCEVQRKRHCPAWNNTKLNKCFRRPFKSKQPRPSSLGACSMLQLHCMGNRIVSTNCLAMFWHSNTHVHSQNPYRIHQETSNPTRSKVQLSKISAAVLLHSRRKISVLLVLLGRS